MHILSDTQRRAASAARPAFVHFPLIGRFTAISEMMDPDVSVSVGEDVVLPEDIFSLLINLTIGSAEFETWSEKNELKPGKMHDQDDKFVGTSPVGYFKAGATPAGVYDLAGNVFEWTADWFAPYSPAPAEDPKGPANGEKRVARGGAFNAHDPTWVRAAYRWGNLPQTYNHGIGIRCAAPPKKQSQA